MRGEVTGWPSVALSARWMVENANALRECANADFYYGRTSFAFRQREQANALLRWAGFMRSFPKGTTVTGYYGEGSFRFRVPAPVGVAS